MATRTGSRSVQRWCLGALAAFAAGLHAEGQTCTPDWIGGFVNPPGFDQELRGVAFFDSGNGRELYVAGHFSAVGLTQFKCVARWTGSTWQPVGPPFLFGAGYWIGVMDATGSPALYVSGDFTIPAISANRVASWDGRQWSALGPGFNNTVRAMTQHDFGSGPAIYAVGLFNKSGETTVNGIARWDGAAWQPLITGLQQPPGYPPNTPGTGYAVASFDLGDGPKLYVGGGFAGAGGVPANSIACWDGQAWSPLGSGLYLNSISMMKMILFDHGEGPQLTVGGSFALVPNQPARPRVARWTGTQWVPVGSDLSSSPLDYVNSLVALPGAAGPTLYAGGVFTGASWLNQVNYVARLINGDWKTVDGGMGGGQPGSHWVRSLILEEGAAGPEIWAAGSFKIAGDAVANRVARWDGERWHGVERNLALVGKAKAIRAFDDGTGEKLFVGGLFSTAGDRVCNGIAAWNGKEWEKAGDGMLSSTFQAASVEALLPFDDGSGSALYATGHFTTAGGGPAFSIARWNGSHWSAPGGNGLIGSGGTAPGFGRALASFGEGPQRALYVGGTFERAGAVITNGIARWNGTSWSAPGSGPGVPLGSTVYALAVFDEVEGERLLAGGDFSSINGVSASAIARWDGSQWSEVGGGFTGSPAVVWSLATINDGAGTRLYAGASYKQAGGQDGSVVAVWDGAQWRPLPWAGYGLTPLGGTVSTLTWFDDGQGPALYVGGALTISGHQGGVTGLLRYREGLWSLPGGGLAGPNYSTVTAAGLWHDGRRPALFVGGSFGGAGGVSTLGFAAWRGCPVCEADCDRNGSLNGADFGCFQTKFMNQDPSADCNQDSALTVNDFGCFQARFAAGCP